MASCPQPEECTISDIDFEKVDYTSFLKTAANLQGGAAIILIENLSAGVSYAWSVSDVKGLPNSYIGNTHLSIWNVNVKYNLVK